MAPEREKIIQITFNSRDELYALTNQGNIHKMIAQTEGAVEQWSPVEKPIEVNYKAKIDAQKEAKEIGEIKPIK